jgi:hypothetical protein
MNPGRKAAPAARQRLRTGIIAAAVIALGGGAVVAST